MVSLAAADILTLVRQMRTKALSDTLALFFFFFFLFPLYFIYSNSLNFIASSGKLSNFIAQAHTSNESELSVSSRACSIGQRRPVGVAT